MSAPLHPQNVIALVWDFDKTLIPGYMQDPIFAAYGTSGQAFWMEVNGLVPCLAKLGVRVHPDTCYLNHLITYVQQGRMPGLTNAKLREMGAQIAFHPGLPQLLESLRHVVLEPPFDAFDLKLEHYIVSTGLREMIEGSAIRPFVDGIWASEFIETPPAPGFDPSQPPQAGAPISQIAIAYDNTSKTRAIFEINKGANKDPNIDVNATMKGEDRRVPFQHMIYIADGPSDVPAFSLMRQNGGAALAVYDERSDASFEQVERLRKDGRIDYFGPADYREASPTTRWLKLRVKQIAESIVSARKAALKERVGVAPRHLGD